MSRPLKGGSISKEFDDAIEFFGSLQKMADALGVSGSQIRRLRVGQYKFKPCYALKIEELTKGKIKAADLMEKFLKG